MSGIVGHSLYAILGAKAAAARKLPMVPLVERHRPSYLAGAYLGCDVQTMPEAVCIETGKEAGYGTVPLEKCPETGGPVRPWKLRHEGREYTPREIHELFYGRAHLRLGWTAAQKQYAVPWDRLPEYFAAVIADAGEGAQMKERTLAYLLGWIVHVVSDSLIKSVQPGIELHLLDGKYTARNRPVQDLVGFHEVGVREFGLNWPQLLSDLAAAPLEQVQAHYMRVAVPRGRLAKSFPDGWWPDRRPLLDAVLLENRRWVRFHAQDVLDEMKLTRGAAGEPECKESIRRAVGMGYREMVAAAEKAGFRQMLSTMGEAVASMFESVVQRSPELARLGGMRR